MNVYIYLYCIVCMNDHVCMYVEDIDMYTIGYFLHDNSSFKLQLSKEREEAELKQLHKSFLEPKGKDKLGQSASSADLNSDGKPMVRKLMITRTFRDETEGHLYTRMEVVTKPLVIEAYLKIRKTKTDDFM